MNQNGKSGISAALIEPPSGYADWLAELKTRIHTAQSAPTQTQTPPHSNPN